MRAADGSGSCLGEPEVLDLALGNQLAHGAGHVLDGHGRVDAVLVEQVDGFDAQAAQRSFGDPPDLLGPGIGALHPPVHDVPAELRGHLHLVADRRDRLTHEFLVDVGAIDLGGVDERDALVHGVPDHVDHVVAVSRVGAVAHGHPHRAEADCGYLKALPKCPGVHGGSFHCR